MWAVKIPVYEPYNDLDQNGWATIEEFDTNEEAIEFAKREFGTDDEGTIQLVYEEI